MTTILEASQIATICANDELANSNAIPPCEITFPSPQELQKACALIPGRNILEVTPANIYNYSFGAFALVERDIREVLGRAAAQLVLNCLRQSGILAAFRVREELINYKKVSLHIHQQGVQLERSLGQLASFFREDERTAGGFWIHSERRTELSDSHMQCKGRCQASFDARHLVKHICCVPRHPAEERAAPLEQLPRSLHSWRLGAAAKDLMVHAKVLDVQWDPAKSSQVFLAPDACTVGCHETAMAYISCQHWPEHIHDFVRSVLICRGVDKALRMCDELRRTCEALEASLQQAEAVLEKLSLQPTPTETRLCLEAEGREENETTDWLLGGAMLYKKHINLLTGCLPLLRESVHWLRRIENVSKDDPGRLFVAGDAKDGVAGAPPVSFVPCGYGANALLDDVFFQVLRRHKPEMQRILATTGWPSHVSQANENKSESGAVALRKVCKVCRKVSGLWVLRGICCECEDAERAQGRCPFNTNCRSSWFCMHDRRCFVCDCHSCDQCRISRCDSDAVLDIVSRLRPTRIFLDFDRTLASTRSGGEPFMGKHNVDQELLSLFWNYPGACAIVTRNPHVAEIKQFLVMHGAPENVEVHSLKRPRSKAEFIIPVLASGDTAVFVDDSIAELVDPCVAQDTRVFRILFLRSML